MEEATVALAFGHGGPDRKPERPKESSMSTTVIDHLKSFNRKERFLLLCDALGFDNQTFPLAEDFINKLSGCIGHEIPHDAYAAMDYHLDWLQMALYLASDPSPLDPILNDDLVNANQ